VKSFRRLAALFLVHWPTALAAAVAMSVVAASMAVLTSMVGALFDLLSTSTAPAQGAGAALEAARSHGVGLARLVEDLRTTLEGRISSWLPVQGLALPVLLVFCLVVKNASQFTADYLINRVGLSVVRDLRQRLYDSILRRSVRFFSQTNTGELTSRIMADIERIQASLGSRFGDLLQDSLTLLVLTLYLVSLDRRLAILTFLIAPLVLLPLLRMTRKLRRTATQSQERVAILTGILQETIRGHRIVKAFGMEPFESRRFQGANLAYVKTLLREVKISAASTPLMETIAGTAMVGVLAFAQHEISRDRATLGSFVSFLAGVGLLYAPAKRLNKGNMALQQALAASERVFDVLGQTEEISDRPDAVDLAGFSGEILFDDVTFEYRTGEPVLIDVRIPIRKGEVVAFVGPSGAGKSTLVQLVPRFHDPTSGTVRIDGRDIREVRQASLRRLIGLVTQDVFLFDASVRANIAYGRSDVPLERVREAARAAFADEFVMALPEGYDTVVGEAGVRLSGGQKQRIAIARALLKDPPILILDEATSALDVESERSVQSALENLMKDRTTLVVAHRLSTIRRADRIVVLDGGRVVEVGNHAELLARDGLYARLHRLHSFEGEGAATGEGREG
jgi:subfamily B ATP-binding cassette protein MsbA